MSLYVTIVILFHWRGCSGVGKWPPPPYHVNTSLSPSIFDLRLLPWTFGRRIMLTKTLQQDQTGSNGANLSFPKEFGIGAGEESPDTHNHDRDNWLVG